MIMGSDTKVGKISRRDSLTQQDVRVDDDPHQMGFRNRSARTSVSICSMASSTSSAATPAFAALAAVTFRSNNRQCTIRSAILTNRSSPSAPELAGTCSCRRSRRHSSRPDWGATALCSSYIRNRTGRRPWASFPPSRSRIAGRSVPTRERSCRKSTRNDQGQSSQQSGVRADTIRRCPPFAFPFITRSSIATRKSPPDVWTMTSIGSGTFGA